MKIEKIGDSHLPQQNKRFHCHKCGSIFLAEGEGDEWFVKNTPVYLPPILIAYCPICGAEVKRDL